MAISEDGIECLLEEARHGTLLFPCGRWVYASGSYEIAADGEFKQKLRSGITIRGRLIQDESSPWMWSVLLEDGGQIEFHLTSECQLRAFCVRHGQQIRTASNHAGMLNLMNDLDAKRAWTVGLNGITDFAIQNVHLTDDMLATCVQAVHKIFEWVDGFNQRYKSISGYDNPQFNSFMQDISEAVAERIRAGGIHDPRRTPRLILATHFIRCLFQRWPYVTKSCMLMATTYHVALKACRDAYSQMLCASRGKLHACFSTLGEENLCSLLKQLEALAEREEKDAKELPYARLLEMSACISARLHQMLPLTEKESKYFNLEYLLLSSANHAPDLASFSLDVARYMGLAATNACDEELAAKRLAESWTTSLKLARACLD